MIERHATWLHMLPTLSSFEVCSAEHIVTVRTADAASVSNTYILQHNVSDIVSQVKQFGNHSKNTNINNMCDDLLRESAR